MPELRRGANTYPAVVARLDRAIQYAAPYRLVADAPGILGALVKPGHDSGGEM